MLAQVVREERNFAQARDMFDECSRLFEELGDDHYVLLAKFHVAWMAGELGDRERERAIHEDNLVRARAASNKRMESVTLENLARFESFDGRFEAAIALIEEAYGIVRELDEPVDIADAISRFAWILARAGKVEAAVSVLSSSETLREEIGVRRSWVMKRNEETLELARPKLDKSQFAAAWDEGKSMTPDEAVELARAAIVEA
jgi:tetratricopeptide (TPR) repeat protein